MSRSVTVSLVVDLTEFTCVAGSRKLAQTLHMQLYDTKYYKGNSIRSFIEDYEQDLIKAIGRTHLDIIEHLVCQKIMWFSDLLDPSVLEDELNSNIQLSLYYCD